VPAKKIRVALGDDQALNLEGLNAVLKGQPNLSVVGSTNDPRQLVELVKSKSPDVVVVDSQMLRRVTGKGINGTSKVIQIADTGTAVSATPATRAIVRRSGGVKALKEAIRRVARGETVEMPASSGKTKLSKREQDIARLVAKGLSNRAIADELQLSEQSVKNLVSRILKKMSLENRVQLALAQR
jgi:DNA-binding NarL/FixJ family response regulator